MRFTCLTLKKHQLGCFWGHKVSQDMLEFLAYLLLAQSTAKTSTLVILHTSVSNPGQTLKNKKRSVKIVRGKVQPLLLNFQNKLSKKIICYFVSFPADMDSGMISRTWRNILIAYDLSLMLLILVFKPKGWTDKVYWVEPLLPRPHHLYSVSISHKVVEQTCSWEVFSELSMCEPEHTHTDTSYERK